MSKERYKYHCDDYDYDEIIYDTKNYEECDSMQMATKILNRQDAKISDLEAKLAEYKEQVEIVEKQHSNLLMTIFNGHKENFELKQQLAEKEKEISITKQLLENYRLQCHEFLKNETNVYSKSKTEFAIQQLQRVKEEYYSMDGIELVGFIDQIIKELEGVK